MSDMLDFFLCGQILRQFSHITKTTPTFDECPHFCDGPSIVTAA